MSVQGGEVILRNNKRLVDIREDIAVISMEKQPNQQYLLALQTTILAEASGIDTFIASVAQRNERGEMVGGATVMFTAASDFAGQDG